jgi:3-phenylpropionate/trans-cinnamate dioxygenase ferredoxin component
MTSWQTVARTGDLPAGKVGVFTIGDHEIALANADGAYFAIDDLCTHDGGSLDQGELEGNEIECPRHCARFDIRTGAATQLPAFEPVETHAVRIEGGEIQVSVEHQ